jgi:uncharacterized protein (TIGR02421 family)
MQDLKHFEELDAKLCILAKPIKILSTLGWDAQICEQFLADYQKGRPKLPVITYPQSDYQDLRRELVKIMKDADHLHPVGRYIFQTAWSYVVAARMLENVGKEDFHKFSQMLYGRPSDKVNKISNLDLAEDFIRVTGEFAAVMPENTDAQHCILPSAVAAELKDKSNQFFGGPRISVVIDPHLASKAAAGSERVRIRGMTHFSRPEIDQLLEHEIYVHSATMMNGKGQPHLKSLGLGAPRTTATQEGLATFAEFITNTMDLGRLRRIALRIKATQIAMDGADFIEVFRYFLASGQSKTESFQSAARIFRGGDVHGKIVFTKDTVYLKGLLSVHTFLRKAIASSKILFPAHLFSGRMTLGDVQSLEPFFTNGYIVDAVYKPAWVAKRESLAAYLCYSAFTDRLNISEVQLADFLDDVTRHDLDTDVPQIA